MEYAPTSVINTYYTNTQLWNYLFLTYEHQYMFINYLKSTHRFFFSGLDLDMIVKKHNSWKTHERV